MKRKAIVWLVVLLISVPFFCFPAFAIWDEDGRWEEGGFCDDDPDAPGVVYNFIKYFPYEMYVYTWDSDWYYNNSAPYGVDTYDFVYYCGHGNRWRISMANGTTVYLDQLSRAGHWGFGNLDMEFCVLHSCLVIPGPPDVTDWWSRWISPQTRDAFDGVHMICGFRTSAWKFTAPSIANYYGGRVSSGDYVLWRWLDATHYFGNHSYGYDAGAVVLYPAAENDRYSVYHCADCDPTISGCGFRIWYYKY